MVGNVPDRGDLVYIEMNPQAGHEQAGTRPALVLSSRVYNQKAGLAILCPITNQSKGYPFEVALPDGLPITGVVLADQVKSLDWSARHSRVVGQAPQEVLDDVLAKILTLLNN